MEFKMNRQFDPDRRKILTKACHLGAAGTFCTSLASWHERAEAIPELAILLLPTIGHVLGQFLNSIYQNSENRRMAAAQFQHEYSLNAFHMGDGLVSKAHHNGALMTLGFLSNNVDGHGSKLGIFNGLFGVERNDQQGFLLPSELAHFGPLVAAGEPLPIPVESVKYRAASHAEADILDAKLNASLGSNRDQFRNSMTPKAIRSFSSSRRPRGGSSGDLTSILAVSNQQSFFQGQPVKEAKTFMV
jgi:hypothetical protein